MCPPHVNLVCVLRGHNFKYPGEIIRAGGKLPRFMKLHELPKCSACVRETPYRCVECALIMCEICIYQYYKRTSPHKKSSGRQVE